MHIKIKHLKDYRFEIDFGSENIARLHSDENPPLGKGEGPTPAMLVGAAVANCLAASLQFCMSKRRASLDSLEAESEVELYRNEANRWRIKEIRVQLSAVASDANLEALKKCQEVFEDFCIVTESIRQGIPVTLKVL